MRKHVPDVSKMLKIHVFESINHRMAVGEKSQLMGSTNVPQMFAMGVCPQVIGGPRFGSVHAAPFEQIDPPLCGFASPNSSKSQLRPLKQIILPNKFLKAADDWINAFAAAAKKCAAYGVEPGVHVRSPTNLCFCWDRLASLHPMNAALSV